MSGIQIIEREGQRVLTTQQVAEIYGVDSKKISRNFERNSERYTEGIHYFALTGQALVDFKASRQFDDNLKFIPLLYLWTERGCLNHAKSLGTDEAWSVYDKLVETYFRVREQIKPQFYIPQTLPDALRLAADLAEQNAIMAPKAEMFDTFMTAKNAQPMSSAAKSLHIGRNMLFEFLRDQKVLRKNNEPYQEYIDRGYFEVRQITIQRTIQNTNRPQTMVTPKGFEFIAKLLAQKKAM